MSVKHVPSWAFSAGKKPIDLYHSPQAFEASARPLLFMGGVHGDEPEGVELAQKTLAWLIQDSQGEKQVQLPWVLIPCLNPDGYALNQRTNGNGVDLNRNYPSKSWSPEAKAERYNPGAFPGSEPEIQALVKLIEEIQPRLIVHCHAWAPCIVSTGDAAQKDAEYLAEATGYKVMDEIGYPTPGSLSQYGWHDKKIPIICIEEQEGAPLASIWPRFQTGIQKIFLNNSDRAILNSPDLNSPER